MNNIRTVLITGSNRGLGFELAKKLVEQGSHQLILTARDPQQGLEMMSQLKNPKQKIEFHQLDVSNKNSIDLFCAWLEERKIDVVVHNAAVIDNLKISKEQAARDLMNINFHGVIHLQEMIAPYLTDDAKILVVSSDFGKLSMQGETIRIKFNNEMTKEEIYEEVEKFIEMRKNDNLAGWLEQQDGVKTAYCASKVLINAYSRYVLSKQIKTNQNVYCYHPGWCRTEMGGQLAYFSPEEGTKCSLYLINDIPYVRDEKFNGKFFNEVGALIEY